MSASILDAERLAQILPPELRHSACVRELRFLITPLRSRLIPRPPDRTLVELSLGAMLTASSSMESTSTSDVVPWLDLRVLGLEAALAHDTFPLPTAERIAALRKAAGYPLQRFMCHPRMRIYDGAESCARFAAWFAPLAALVDVV